MEANRMKFSVNKMQIDTFIDALDNCKGNVWLSTDQGDMINLKSKLSQLVGISAILKGANIVDAEIHFEDKEDENIFLKLATFG